MQPLTLSLLAGALVLPAAACDMCSVYSTPEGGSPGGPGFFGGVAEQFTHFGTLQDNGQRIDNAPYRQRIDSSVAQFFAGYHLSDRATVQLNIPWVYRSYSRPQGTYMQSGTEQGLGDISLSGTYALLRETSGEFTYTWSLMGGLKLPTGNADRLGDPDIDGVAPIPDSGIGGHDLAVGSGSVDGLIGSSLLLRWHDWMATGMLQYGIRSTGSFGHRYANDLVWSAGPGRLFKLGSDRSLSLQLLGSGESKGKDTFYGVSDDDSAETVVYVGPQLTVNWGPRLTGQLGGDIPVRIANSGLQLVPDYRVRAVLNLRF